MSEEIIAGADLKDETENMYLDFIVGKEAYAIEIRYVLQIIGMREITEMPEMPHGMKGFINLRGSVIPVYSMHLRFNREEPLYTDRACIIVITVGGAEIGLIVDAVCEAVTIQPDGISVPPGMGGASAPSVKGVARLEGGQAVVLIDVPRFVQQSA